MHNKVQGREKRSAAGSDRKKNNRMRRGHLVSGPVEKDRENLIPWRAMNRERVNGDGSSTNSMNTDVSSVRSAPSRTISPAAAGTFPFSRNCLGECVTTASASSQASRLPGRGEESKPVYHLKDLASTSGPVVELFLQCCFHFFFFPSFLPAPNPPVALLLLLLLLATCLLMFPLLHDQVRYFWCAATPSPFSSSSFSF